MNQEIIEKAADFSLWIYENPQTFDFYQQIDDLRFGYKTIGDTVFFAVRGSDNFKNWVRNFRIYPRYFSGCGLVHWGFGSAASKIWKNCKNSLRNFQKDGKRIVFCGHSAGVIGLLLQQRARKSIKNLESLFVGFGCPKPFYRFSSGIKGTVILCQIDDDPVIKLPGGIFFRHRFTEKIFKTDPGFLSVNDHEMEKYRENFKGAKNGDS